jgi:hypothetical protein
MKSGAPGRAPGRPALPSSQTGRRWPSGLPGCRAMDRRAADLRARGDRAAPALGWLTGDPPTVRVGGGGGGRTAVARRSRPGSRLRRTHGTEGCLSQRRELECRSHGTTHELAERAFVGSAGRQRGEHVFVKVRAGSDGMRPRRRRRFGAFGSSARKMQARAAMHLARRSADAGPQSLHTATPGGNRVAGTVPCLEVDP